MRARWCSLILLLYMAAPVAAQQFAEISTVQDRELLIRIDERVCALRLDVLEMQTNLEKLNMALTTIRIESARSGATYGALAGIFSATLAVLFAAAVRAWMENKAITKQLPR